MKRFAAHYLLIQEIGYTKQIAIEVDSNGVCSAVFPLTDEQENVEWHPGVIVLVHHQLFINKESKEASSTIEAASLLSSDNTIYSCSRIEDFDCLKKAFEQSEGPYIAYLLYPFNFTQMQPVAETRHKQLL